MASVAPHARPSSERVVITGFGAFTSFGSGWSRLWEGIEEGRRAIARVTHEDLVPAGEQFTLGTIQDLRPVRELVPGLKPPPA